MRKILVTGGLGYIGSHVVVELQKGGYEVIIIDNLSNSNVKMLGRIAGITGVEALFEDIDLRDKGLVAEFFNRHSDIDGVIHFAALKSVGESVIDPLLYYQNNVNSLVYLLQEMEKIGSRNIIFSSSCTVYGQADELPVTETAKEKEPESPYGRTKQIGEKIIRDACNTDKSFNSISLRYFNPIGAHPSSKIGELPVGPPQNLVPYITQTAIGSRKKLLVFGDDYPTRDGTCIRDYIHVVDLAKAHVVAIKRLFQKETYGIYEFFNIGTGMGITVLEVIKAFEEVTGIDINYSVVDKRPGDVISAYADTKKANTILGWYHQYSLKEALNSAWEWQKGCGKVFEKSRS